MNNYKLNAKHYSSPLFKGNRTLYPNIQMSSSKSQSNLFQFKHKRSKCKSQSQLTEEEPNHILYFFNNSQSLRKVMYLKQRANKNQQTTKLLTDKQTNDGNSALLEDELDIDKIMNPFLIKNYSNKRDTSFSSLKKSKSATCNLNCTGYRTMSKIPSLFNGYVTRYTRFSPAEILERDRYSKEKINIKEVLRNQKANQVNYIKSRLRLFQMKQSIHLYKNEKDIINRYKTCAVYNK